MKRNYTKPDIAFESFALSTSIAACPVKIETSNGGQCGLLMDDVFIFTMGIVGCEAQIPDDGSNGICYHVPVDGFNLFNS